MDIFEDIIGGFLRFIWRVFVEIVVELLIRSVGYAVCRVFSKNVFHDSVRVLVVGCICWVLIILFAVYTLPFVSKQIDIDTCLDRGGRFNYEESTCEFN